MLPRRALVSSLLLNLDQEVHTNLLSGASTDPHHLLPVPTLPLSLSSLHPITQPTPKPPAPTPSTPDSMTAAPSHHIYFIKQIPPRIPNPYSATPPPILSTYQHTYRRNTIPHRQGAGFAFSTTHDPESGLHLYGPHARGRGNGWKSEAEGSRIRPLTRRGLEWFGWLDAAVSTGRREDAGMGMSECVVLLFLGNRE